MVTIKLNGKTIVELPDCTLEEAKPANEVDSGSTEIVLDFDSREDLAKIAVGIMREFGYGELHYGT